MDNFNGYKDMVYNIIGSAMRVHSILNYGLSEALYQESLQLELADNGVDSEREKEICCYYKHHLLDKMYKADLVVGDVIVELKSVKEILPEHRAHSSTICGLQNPRLVCLSTLERKVCKVSVMALLKKAMNVFCWIRI